MPTKNLGSIVLLCAALSVTTQAASQESGQTPDAIVSSITESPTNVINSGKLVWVDLLTDDVSSAVQFYESVFGWEAQLFGDGSYAEMYANKRLVCAIAEYEDDGAEAGNARWLTSISVQDVDSAANSVLVAGGKVLEPAFDLANRGRLAVVEDSQGAVLILLRASGGDPVDDDLVPNQWAWAELWTRDPEQALKFYTTVVDYVSHRLPAGDGEERILLASGGKARATIVRLPWEDVTPNWVPYIPVRDVSLFESKIREAGGTIIIPSSAVPGQTNPALAMDPTGGVFAIQQMELKQ